MYRLRGVTHGIGPTPFDSVSGGDTHVSEAPKHLRDATRAWYAQIVEEYALEPHALRTLQAAGEAWDRYEQAREIVDAEGCIVRDRFKQPKKHPACGIELDARTAYLRAMRELGLDADPPDAARPPGLRYP